MSDSDPRSSSIEELIREAADAQPGGPEDQAQSAAERAASDAERDEARQRVFDGLLVAAANMKPGVSPDSILRQAIFNGLSASQIELLVDAIHRATGVSKKNLKKDEARIAGEVKKARQQQAEDEAARAASAAQAANMDDPELSSVQAEFPLVGKAVFYKRHGGKVWAGRQETIDGNSVFVPLHTPYRIDGRLHFSGKAIGKGLRVTVRDEDGKEVQVDLKRSELAGTVDRNMLVGRLMHVGMLIDERARPMLLNALQKADSSNIIAVVDRPGVQVIAGQLIFVTLYGKVLGANHIKAELNPAVRMAEKDVRKGTLEGWMATAAGIAALDRVPHWYFGLILPFAASLVDLLDLDNIIVNLQARTSIGKTLALQMAASAWGAPTVRRNRDGGHGMVWSARVTPNSIESIAEMTSGMGLFLDDLAKVSGKDVSDITFVFADGAGKTRADRTGKARVEETKYWRGVLATTSEHSLVDMVRSDRRATWTPGSAVRMLNIDMGASTNRELGVEANRLARELFSNYGHAGPAFAERLVLLHNAIKATVDKANADALAKGQEATARGLREQLLDGIEKIAANMEQRVTQDGAGDGVSTNSKRRVVAAERRTYSAFALLKLAGQLAVHWGILPSKLDVGATVDWALNCFIGSSVALLAPEDAAIEEIRLKLLSVWESHTAPCGRSAQQVGARANGGQFQRWYQWRRRGEGNAHGDLGMAQRRHGFFAEVICREVHQT